MQSLCPVEVALKKTVWGKSSLIRMKSWRRAFVTLQVYRRHFSTSSTAGVQMLIWIYADIPWRSSFWKLSYVISFSTSLDSGQQHPLFIIYNTSRPPDPQTKHQHETSLVSLKSEGESLSFFTAVVIFLKQIFSCCIIIEVCLMHLFAWWENNLSFRRMLSCALKNAKFTHSNSWQMQNLSRRRKEEHKLLKLHIANYLCFHSFTSSALSSELLCAQMSI